MPDSDRLPPPFSAPYAPDDSAIAARLLRESHLGAEQEARIDRSATRLIEAVRANDDPLGGVEDMLREFALSTKEGLALMVLAEALLRVPDARTADQFIEDKLGQGDFVHHETKSSAFLVNASAWALGMSARVIQPGETPQGTIGRLTKRLGAPAVRAATRQAMRLMGSHFVLGETIEAALDRAQLHSERLPRRRPHRRRAQPFCQPSDGPLRRLAGLDHAGRHAERPGRGIDQERARPRLVMDEIALAELVLDELVGGAGVRNPQQRFRQHHQCQPLLGR